MAATHPVWTAVEQERARFDLINEKIASGESEVQQFFDGAVVFITGASGFLGKQLAEKLFRSCKIKKMYLVLRPQKHANGQKRLQIILQDPLFEYLHKNQPDFVKKIFPVDGDISKHHMDIDEKLWRDLADEVNVIIHSAATVNFTDTLKNATLTNVRGTLEVLNLAKACKNLKSVVHISTAYVHSTKENSKQTILEEFHKTPMSPDLLLQLVEELDETTLNDITPQLLRQWPNTYSFTKAIAEELIRLNSEDLPICIVRPAIVMTALTEPPGWIDKTAINGPVGFMLGGALGALHVCYGDQDANYDMVPVDYVNNAVIAAAYVTAKKKAMGEREIKIYTVTRTRNPLQGRDINDFLHSDTMRQFIPPQLVWYPYLFITKNKLVFTLLSCLLHFVPGYLADTVLILLGKKPKAIRLLYKAFKQNRVYGVYMTYDWEFGDDNLLQMYNNLSETDKIIYQCDMGKITSLSFMLVGSYGSRKYILKEDFKNSEYALRKQSILRILNVVYIVAYLYLLFKILSTVVLSFLNFSHSVKLELV